jgi:hypothetical protein
MGRIQALSAQQGTDGTGVLTGFGLLDDGAFVIRGEPAPCGLSSHLGIGDGIRRDRSRRAPGVVNPIRIALLLLMKVRILSPPLQ